MKKFVICLIILVALLSLISYSWLNRASISNTQTRYKNFHVSEFNLQIQLPETTVSAGDYFGTEEVLSSTFLNDQTLKYWGYIQIWKIPDLEKFLQNSKSHSVIQFTYYNQHSIKVNNLNGIEVDWSAIMQNERSIVAREIFLKNSNSDEVLRVSFFTEGKEIPSNLNQIYNYIISSIKWK